MTANGSEITQRDIARVGKGTPAGEWFRRYWLPVGLDADLKDIPVCIRVLGENLVLFRDGQGRPGLLGLHCPHRGASLEYGDAEADGLRCPYHGWLFDVTGQCLEQPAEPKGSTFYQRVRHLAYPVREMGGLLFAYMGRDGDSPPPLPRYAPLVGTEGQRQIEPIRYQAFNWFNFIENGADPTHIWNLHRYSGFGLQSWGDHFFNPADPPEWEPVRSEWGLDLVMHRPGPTPDTEYVDTFSLGLPSILQIADTEFVHLRLTEAAIQKANNAHWMFVTPIDDDSHMLFTVDYYTGPDLDFFEHLKQTRIAFEPPPRKPYDQRPYAQARGNVRQEDLMTQSTQPILSERSERLGTSDRGVIMLRRLIVEAMQQVQRGERPLGVLSWEEADRVHDVVSFVGTRPRQEFAAAEIRANRS